MNELKKLNYILDSGQKTRLSLVLVIIIIGAFWELLGVTAILPFIEVAIKPSSVEENKWLSILYEKSGVTSMSSFMALLAILLICIYIIKNVYLTVMNYIIYRFTYNNQRKLSVKVLKAYLRQQYVFFLENNSADLMRNVYDDVSGVFDTILSFMQLMVEMIVCVLILVFLFIQDKTITVAVGCAIVIALLVIIRAIRTDLRRRGDRVRRCRGDMDRWILQTFGGIKESMVMERTPFFAEKYDGVFKTFAHNHCIYQTLSYVSKPLMETVCVGGILAVIAFKSLRGVNSQYFISIMSVFAVSAFRLLPAFNRITGYLSRIMFNHSSVSVIYNDLKKIEEHDCENTENISGTDPLDFNREIRLSKIGYRYPNTEDFVIRGVDIVVPKNRSIAFVGPSGAGKTTLADIVLGILQPTEGQVLIDDVDVSDHMAQWHHKIGYIPQNIYLMDDSIKNNIAYALSDDEIDEDRINNVIEEAQLKSFIDGLEQGADTIIGEDGVRLSGGQRQRIGIARALYNDPDVLVLDEATSALDNDTETAVMEAIDSLAGKKTLIIIAHRLTTIRNCDIVYEVKDGHVIKKDQDNSNN